MQRTILFLLKDPGDQPDFGNDIKQFYVACSPNTQHAIQALSDQPYDAVVADIAFQHEGDIPFFDMVMNRFPKVNRIALCNVTGDTKVPSAASIHQYVQKPASVEDIVVGMERCKLLDQWLLNLKMKRLFKLLKRLPSVPTVYFRLVKLLQDPQTELDDIGKVIAEDPSLTTKVLQVVNSAIFGLSQRITNVSDAISYIGVERTKALAMATHSFANQDANLKGLFSIEALWKHSIRTGSLAQWVAREHTGNSKLAEEAFTAGVLHDIGKLIVAANLPAETKKVVERCKDRTVTFVEAEMEVLEVSHAEIGACILGSWGIPPVIVEAIAFHHTPTEYFNEGFSSTTALHLADALEHESGMDREFKYPKINEEYVQDFQIDDELKTWRNEAKDIQVAA